MDKLTVADLFSLEEYHKRRPDFRRRVLEHKRNRQAAIGPNVTLYFEDRLTIQYQIQEMLRIERIFESEAIEDELGVYNPLIPDGTNFKATMMIEYPDADERKEALNRLGGIEHAVSAQVAELDRVVAHADEDLGRTSEEKTSAVHFLRFELTEPMRTALQRGAELRFAVDHPQYRHELVAPAALRDSLAADFA
jgi:Protein of unknown function (DUF3501)